MDGMNGQEQEQSQERVKSMHHATLLHHMYMCKIIHIENSKI
jgi:hypothetical protein